MANSHGRHDQLPGGISESTWRVEWLKLAPSGTRWPIFIRRDEDASISDGTSSLRYHDCIWSLGV